MSDEITRQMWTRGDYEVVGDWFASASVRCLDGLSLEGARVLDVACGTGAVAIEAARRGAEVVAVDITPSMLESAAARADAAGVQVEFHEASFADLSAFRGFDVVASAFGVVFALEPAGVAAQLHAACAADGVITLTGWDPEGAFGALPSSITAQLPSPGAEYDPAGWATASGLEARFDRLGRGVTRLTRERVSIPFESPEGAVAQMLEHSGPWQLIFEVLGSEAARAEARAALRGHLDGFFTDAEAGPGLEVGFVHARVGPADAV